MAFDSCTIKGRIIYDPVSLKIKGVSNLEDVSVMRLAMQRLCDDDADDVDMNKHHLVFKWSSIHPDCNVSFILARFSLHTITADFYLMEFPKILRELAKSPCFSLKVFNAVLACVHLRPYVAMTSSREASFPPGGSLLPPDVSQVHFAKYSARADVASFVMRFALCVEVLVLDLFLP